MSDDGVIGVDRPPRDKRRLRWWELALLAVLALGAIAWIVDELRTTDTEAVATAYVDYSRALVDRDGQRACSLLGSEGQYELAALAAAVDTAPPDRCDEAVQAPGLVTDEQRDQVAELDPERVEDFVSIDGGRATITVPGGVVEAVVSLAREGGDWLLVSPIDSVEPVDDPEASNRSEVIRGADAMCRVAAQREAIVLTELDQGAGPTPAAAPSLREVNSDLAQSLTRLSNLHPTDEVKALLPQLPRLVRASAALETQHGAGARRSDFNRAVDAYVTAGNKLAAVAGEHGFDQTGCAARPGAA